MPVEHVCTPHSPEWKQLRLGIPTASNFHKIMTPKTRKPSDQRVKYRSQLIAEWWLGESLDEVQTQFMARGIELEDEVVEAFEFDTGLETKPGNYWTTYDGKIGCTPDRLIGDDGILEMKAPAPWTQVGYILDGELEENYRCQLQGQLWILERTWNKIYSYHPKFPRKLFTMERDEPFIKDLSGAVRNFADWVEDGKREWVAKYGEPVRPPKEAEAEDSLGVTDADVDAIYGASL